MPTNSSAVVRETDRQFRSLTPSEKRVIENTLEDLGYKRLSDLVAASGRSSVAEFLADFQFTSLRDFFLGWGWYERLEPFRRSNGNGHKGNRTLRRERTRSR